MTIRLQSKVFHDEKTYHILGVLEFLPIKFALDFNRGFLPSKKSSQTFIVGNVMHKYKRKYFGGFDFG